MHKSNNLDATDVKLLRLLADDSSTTTTNMVSVVNLSIPAINKRIAKLKQSGVIERFTVNVNNEKIGKPILAFVLIILERFTLDSELMTYVMSESDILECHAITGTYDYILKICASDIESLEKKLLHLKRNNGVAKSYTMLALQKNKCLPTALPDF